MRSTLSFPCSLCLTLLACPCSVYSDEDGSPNSSYSEKDLRDTVMNFLIAGQEKKWRKQESTQKMSCDCASALSLTSCFFLSIFSSPGRDTTALLLSWFFYQLSEHPDIEARIIAEMDRVLSEESGEISFDSMKRMTFLHSCIMESLRIFPSVPFNGFTALKDDVLPGGFFVPKDTYVVYSAYILHRRADLYPDPLRFDPDRWDRKPPKPFEFMSFHGGPRECLGRDMAYLEAKIMIVTLLSRFRMRMHPSARVELKRAIILTARRGIHMRLEVPNAQQQQQSHDAASTPVSESESTSRSPMHAASDSEKDANVADAWEQVEAESVDAPQ